MTSCYRRSTDATRRTFLAAAIATAATLPLTARASMAERMPLGVQLWMVKDALAADPAATLHAIAAAGFTHVELAGWPPGSSARFGDALAASGLSCRCAHLPILAETPDELARTLDAAALVVTHVFAPIPAFPGIDALAPAERPGRIFARQMSADDWRWNADRLNAVAAEAAPRGLNIGYHNHNFEFAPLADGTIPMDILLANTDPARVHFEIDVGHLLLAGRDPFALLAAHPGRFRAAHLKEWRRPFAPSTRFPLPPSGDFGSGGIDWPAWFTAARAAGIAHMFVERDNLPQADQLPALAQAGRYFTESGVVAHP